MIREEREDAIDIIQSILDKYEEDECLVTEITIGDGDIEAFRMAIEALDQEPTDKNFPKADIDAIVKAVNAHWELIIDEIRAEIESKYGRCSLTEHIVQYDGICTSRNEIGDIADILQIIDKYKAESEGKE